MRDNNVLSRHMRPAGRKLGIGFVNWRCLRTSHVTWLKMAGADVKRRSGTDAPLEGEYDARHLPTIHSRVAA